VPFHQLGEGGLIPATSEQFEELRVAQASRGCWANQAPQVAEDKAQG
jgi:hypothetical protein